MQCPECKHENPREAKFCVFCGKQVPAPQPETVACAGCDRTVKSDFKFCPFCGHAMEKRHRAKFCARCGTSIDGTSGDLPLCSRCLPTHHHNHPQQHTAQPPYGTPPPPPPPPPPPTPTPTPYGTPSPQYGTPHQPPPPYGAPPHLQYAPQPPHYGAPQPPPPYGAPPAQYGPAGTPQYAPQPPAGYQGYPPQQAGPQICRVCQRPSDQTCLCEEHKKSHTVCQGCGRGIEKSVLLCPDCKNVTDIPRDFTVNTDDYEHKNDRDAMNALRSIKALNMAIDKLSKQFGKSWVESQFIGGGIKVTESQFPRIQRLAVLAARVLGVRRLPEIYISGDIGWTSDTYGSESDAFVVLGTYLTRALSDLELLFVLGHEIAHVKSGHAMYRTVAKVFAGYSGPRGVMGGGILGLLDMQKLLSMSIELPLLAWIRESEITGDCAGLLVVRNIDVARKVLLLQALRSPDLFKEINHEAYLKQQEEAENKIGKLSEFLSQNTPYVARRIRFLNEYAAGPVYRSAIERMSRSRDIRPTLDTIDGKTGRPGGQNPPVSPGAAAGPQAAAPGKGGPAASPAGAPPKHAAPPRVDDSVLRGFCPECRAPYTVAKSRIPKEGSVQLRCQKCKKTFPLRSEDEKLRGSCPNCSEPFSVVKSRLPKQGRVHLRCQKCKGTFPLEALSARTEPAAKAAQPAQAADKFGFDPGYDA